MDYVGKEGYRMKLSKKQLKQSKEDLVELRRGYQSMVIRTTRQIEALRREIHEMKNKSK
jgi:hypothetical protein